MNMQLTDISIVLDRSGSMNAVKTDTIGGFNEFLAAQQGAAGDAILTLAQFNHYYEIVYDAVPIMDVQPLTKKNYVPDGTTALLDAIGQTITSTGSRLATLPEEQRPGRVIVVIMTDGLENSSRKYSLEEIKGMITHQTEVYSWDFVFIGANQDAIETGAGLGIDRGSSLTYDADEAGVRAMFHSVSSSMASYRSSEQGKREPFFSEQDRKKQKKGEGDRD
jgi:uncharacterized protein YegL